MTQAPPAPPLSGLVLTANSVAAGLGGHLGTHTQVPHAKGEGANASHTARSAVVPNLYRHLQNIVLDINNHTELEVGEPSAT